MEGTEQIKVWQDFFTTHYHAQILEQSRKGEHWLVVDFLEVAKDSPDLAEDLLNNPEDALKAGEIAIEGFDLPGERKPFTIRIKNLPATQTVLIRNIRSPHLKKLVTINGVVRQKSEVRPQVTSAKFECPSCGNVLNILQLDSQFKEPTRCSCGRKGRFRQISKELVDAQHLTLEESSEDLDGGEQPKRMKVFLKNDLVSPLSEKRTNPGQKILVVGQVKEVPIILRTGGQSTRFDLIVEANGVEGLEEDFSDLTTSPEEEAAIKAIAADPKYIKNLVGSVAPSIYGLEEIKEAMLMQLVGGVRKKREDGVITRGDIHILLIGDPGAAKSQILRRIHLVAPKARYVSGKGASGAGLSAAVVKDEFLQGWSLEAGAMVLANRGLLCIDEMDKMNKEDASSLHEALEQQTITISKANIQATLRCETTVLAAANPKFGRFDPFETVANQINLPPTLINRFDLIFPVKDVPDAKRDEIMAKFILELHQNVNKADPAIATNLLRKFVAYARNKIFPRLTTSAVEELQAFYLRMRKSSAGEGGSRAVPISARQLEGLVRLTEAAARMRLSDSATKKDARKAIEMMDFCLRQVAYDEKTGTLDIDRIASDMPASARNKIGIVKEILEELESKLGKSIPFEEVQKMAQEKGMQKTELEDVVQKLKRAGDVFEPRPGLISRI
ncbi:MAG: minichromosome maintenance protein MCM [Nanoarchaeota archaeon]